VDLGEEGEESLLDLDLREEEPSFLGSGGLLLGEGEEEAEEAEGAGEVALPLASSVFPPPVVVVVFVPPPWLPWLPRGVTPFPPVSWPELWG
jgi:hypothetical protein